MNWLQRLIRKPDDEGESLIHQVQEEKKRFLVKRNRAERVLIDFRAAERVIRGNTGGQRGA